MKFDQKYIILKGIKKFSHGFQNSIFQSRYFVEWWLFKSSLAFLKDNFKLCIKLKYKDLTAKSLQHSQSVPIYLEVKIKPNHRTFRTPFYKKHLGDWFWDWSLGLTLFRHWFHQLAIFRNNFFLILTLPGSSYTPLQNNTCFKSAMKILGESTTFGQR